MGNRANITVADRKYPMNVSVKTEEHLRQAESLIKTMISRLNEDYNYRDIQDKLSIVLINIATQLINCQALNNSRNSTIENIDRKLGLYLEEKGSLDNIE
jgi:cell division protein ZapA (FtsZ GTPase activity inhibitor)